MKLRCVIEVDNADLDAVAFALGLTPKTGKCRILQGQVNAQNAITERMQETAQTMVRNAHELLDTWNKELHKLGAVIPRGKHGPEAQQAHQP